MFTNNVDNKVLDNLKLANLIFTPALYELIFDNP